MNDNISIAEPMARSPVVYEQLGMDFTPIIDIPVLKWADLENVRLTLPQLKPTQQEDVYNAERRYTEGKGRLFTNGTGTGKTFVGLGVAKRFWLFGAKNIIIVVPTDQKCNDWIEEGQVVGLKITCLNGIKDAGEDIVVTTYANYYQNEAILRKKWRLVIYDESHYINQNLQGKPTVYYEKHAIISNLPSAARSKALKEIGPIPRYGDPDFQQKKKQWEHAHYTITKKYVDYTKVLFLSATPFAYHKSIKYADGCLFDIEESMEEKSFYTSEYNKATGFDEFMCNHFGYRMRNNKLTVPENEVNVNLLEREFFEKYAKLNVMSTRMLDIPFDYSRSFVTVDSDIGQNVNRGLEMFVKKEIRESYPLLCESVSTKHNWMYISQLLESIKAQEIMQRILDHLALGRKVVVFHGFNHNISSHPFHFDARKMLGKVEYEINGRALEKEIRRWKENFPEYYNMDLSSLKDTRSTLREFFPEMVEINGTISKKKRKQNIKLFNNDNSGINVVMVQTRAGREGISLHDKTNKMQRVMISLNLPTAPIEGIQMEGRIYRWGVLSNAIYEYVTLQTSFERMAFAYKVALRSKTVENLAMGKLARDLETAFKDGYENSSYFRPNISQGRGGKKSDRTVQEMTPFQKSQTYYWAVGKKKKNFGRDYFATPEPLGFKMVEWLDPKPGQDCLEPSCGHGSISRWFPENCTNHFIELSTELGSRAALVSDGKMEIKRFEDHYKGNKYHRIAMNPPFGKSGKTAFEHLQKAVLNHMAFRNSVLYCIVPDGPAMEKRMPDLYDGPGFQRRRLAGELLLPECTFKRANTKVRCKILKIVTEDVQCNFRKIDLRDCNDINEFFERIENLKF